MQKNRKQASTPAKQPLIIYGRHAVLAALANPRRQIDKLLCTKEAAAEIRQTGKTSPQIVERREIDKLLPPDAVHQGFALFCGRLPSCTLDDILDMAASKEKCHVLILDQVTDPQNIGAIIRSAVAFNTLALILQDKNSPLESGAMGKAQRCRLLDRRYGRLCSNRNRPIEQIRQNRRDYGLRRQRYAPSG